MLKKIQGLQPAGFLDKRSMTVSSPSMRQDAQRNPHRHRNKQYGIPWRVASPITRQEGDETTPAARRMSLGVGADQEDHSLPAPLDGSLAEP